jgi:hypothetical protein
MPSGLSFAERLASARSLLADARVPPMTAEGRSLFEAECFRLWAAGSTPRAIAAVPNAEKYGRLARNLVAADEGPILLAQVAAAPLPTAAAIALIRGEPDPLRDVEHLLRVIEAVTRVALADSKMADTCATVLRAVQPFVSALEHSGTLAGKAGCYPEVYVASVFHELRRSLCRGGIEPTVRAKVAAFGIDACHIYNTQACAALASALKSVGTAAEQSAQTLSRLIEAAARTVPLAFPDETVAAVQRRVPAFTAPPAVPVYRAPTPSPETVGEMLAKRLQPAQHAHTTQQSTPAAQRAVPVSQADRVRAAAQALTRPTVVLPAPRKRDRPAELDEWDVLTTPLRPPQPVAASEAAAPIALVAQAPTNALVGQSAPANLAARKANTRYPCRSKYHAAFAPADKHASAECPYCVVCHMMEFLFNGCARDCCWGHKPTSRKLSLHLGYHPKVLAVAKERLAMFTQRTYLDPIELPQ